MRCWQHGGEGNGFDECDMCQAEEIAKNLIAENREATERATKSTREALEFAAREAEAAARHAAYLQNNPGDYECPACKMKSLKSGASRCPKCQKDVPDGFWEPIWECEKLAAAKAAEDRKKAAAREAERKEQERLAEEKRQKWLASPEYAQELETKRLAVEAAAAAEAAEKKRLHFKEMRNLVMILLGLGIAIFLLVRWLIVSGNEQYFAKGDPSTAGLFYAPAGIIIVGVLYYLVLAIGGLLFG